MTDTREVWRRPGRRVPLDVAKLRAAYDSWASDERGDPIPGRSMLQLAQRAGLTRQHVHGIMTGKHGATEASLRKITAELEIPYRSVLRET